MKTFSALLALCAGNSPVTGEFPSQRPVTRSFDVFFDLRLDKRLSKNSRRRWFETQSRSFWRHCNVFSTPYRLLSLRGVFCVGHELIVLCDWYIYYMLCEITDAFWRHTVNQHIQNSAFYPCAADPGCKQKQVNQFCLQMSHCHSASGRQRPQWYLK